MRTTRIFVLLGLTTRLAIGVPAGSPLPSSIPRSELEATVANSGGGIVRRENIPTGLKIRGIEEPSSLPTERDEESTTSANPAAVLKRSDCNGSLLCGNTSKTDCRAAFARYDDNTAYCGYSSRVKFQCYPDYPTTCFGCTAIYTCSDYNGHCMYGWWLKQQFAKIYDQVGCGICGSYTIPDGDVIGCRVTLNYCTNCQDRG